MLQSESISNGISSKGEHMKNRPGLKQYIFAALGVVILVLLDQYTKLLAIAHLKDQSAFVLWNNVFELHYLENRGAAFGIFQNQRWFFVIMTVVILVIVSWFYGRTPVEKRYLPLRICMIILTAGAIGNFIDRLTRGYVVDFFYFSLIDFPIFNVADIYVTVGVALFAILYLIIGIPVLGIEWIISKFNRKAADISQLRMVQWAFRVILFICGTKVTVIGEENVPKDEAVLYIGNHKSYFDIIITYARCPGLTGYVAKNDMAKVPLLSLWMKRLYCLFINRDDVKEALKTILAGIDHIKNGISMCIFPEGTRNKTDDLMLPFKEGSFKMAEKTGCAIVPMAITGSADILENHFPKVKATHVILEYGKPIYPNELDKETKKKIGAHCQGIIEEMLVKNEKLR